MHRSELHLRAVILASDDDMPGAGGDLGNSGLASRWTDSEPINPRVERVLPMTARHDKELAQAVQALEVRAVRAGYAGG
jgi:hypothetical protein